MGFNTPPEAYEVDDDEEGDVYEIDGHRFKIRAELEEGLRRQEQSSQRTAGRVLNPHRSFLTLNPKPYTPFFTPCCAPFTLNLLMGLGNNGIHSL